MTNERKTAFRQVVLGVLAREDLTISVDHPTNCFILRNQDDTASLTHGGSLGVFSSEENAKAYIEKVGLAGAVIKPFQWDELVEQFGERFGDCLIDHKGEEGFYGSAPLRKGI